MPPLVLVSEVSQHLQKTAVRNQKLLASESRRARIADALLVRMKEKGDALET